MPARNCIPYPRLNPNKASTLEIASGYWITAEACERETLVGPDANDPNVWSGRALQEGFVNLGGCAVLHQCIRLLIGACCAPSHHGYQHACGLFSGPASSGPFGSPVFAYVGKTDPPSRFILSQTSAGKSLASRHCALPIQFLCSCLKLVPSSRPVLALKRRAQGGRQGWPSRLACLLLQRCQATP
jgi:hypothetical protein